MARSSNRPRGPGLLRIGAAVAVAACLLAGCGGDDDEGAGTATTTATTDAGSGTTGAPTTADTTTASTATSTTASTTASTTTSTTGEVATSTTSSGGCVADAPDEPPGSAAIGEVADVDGDGRPDTAWVGSQPDGTRRVGIVTAGGVGTEVQVDTGSPIPSSVLVADADETAPVEIFVSDGRTVSLFAFVDCAIQPVRNPQGEQYLFDLGFRGTGTGVGCVDADGDGRRDLVGLLAGAPDGDTVPWSRTIVELDGLGASNGASDSGSYTEPGDDAAVELLHTVSCGDATITADGIHEPEPG
jgi:hypothetical protein